MSHDSAVPPPSHTPTGYQRTAHGGVKWQPPTPEDLDGQFPQFRVLDLIGRGGMGAVYRGWQTNLDRYVAIKILPPDLDDEASQFNARFKQEAKTMAKLSHPAIIPVFDAGETATGLLYFVMEHIEGTDVDRMVAEQGKLPTEHALAITAHVCDALHYAHTHGVIHRDIKPANVMVDNEGRVRVADFGLAKSTQATAGLTGMDMHVGTADFVAPEALSIGMGVDHRADLYAVGVMLYQMLTGQIPRGHFDLPSHLVPGIDPRYDKIIARAMKTDPAQRYQSAMEIRHDLDGILAVPIVKAGGESSSAIPKQALGVQAPTPRPQPPRGNPPGARAPAAKTATCAPPEKKPPLLPIALIATLVIGVAAFFLLRKGSEDAAPQSKERGLQSAEVAIRPPTDVVSTPSSAPRAADLPQSKVTVPPPAPPEPKKTPEPVAASSSVPPEPAKAAAPVAPPSATPVQDAATKGPVPARLPDPAKWVKVFETPESLGVRPEATWDDGGIHLKGLVHLTSTSITDASVRAKVRLGNPTTLKLRSTSEKARNVVITPGNIKVTVNETNKSLLTLADYTFPGRKDQEIDIEFTLAGKVLMVTVDGKVLGSIVESAEPYPGLVSVHGSDGLIRDIAWQSLEPLNPADEKLATLEREFHERVNREADAPFDTAVTALAANLKAALERTVPTVRGTTTEAMLRAEIARIDKKEPIPSAEEPKLPALLVTLRKTWHTELAKLLAARNQSAAPAKQVYDQALAALQTELEEKGDITRAERVKQDRVDLQKAESMPIGAGLAAAPKKGPVNVRPTKAGKLKMIGCFGKANLPVDAEPFAKFTDFVEVIVTDFAVAALRADGSAIIQTKVGDELKSCTHAAPPLAKLTAFHAVVWGVTEDGRVVNVGANGRPTPGPWDKFEEVVAFSGGDSRKFCAGLKADGSVVIAATADAEIAWMPKPESLPKAKAIRCDNLSLTLLTESGGIMAWHMSSKEVAIPQTLRRGIAEWMNPGVWIPNGQEEPIVVGAFVDRQGNLFQITAGPIFDIAKNVEAIGGMMGAHLAYLEARKGWTVNGDDTFGEKNKAREILGTGTPISWSLVSAGLNPATGGGTTAIFAWIE